MIKLNIKNIKHDFLENYDFFYETKVIIGQSFENDIPLKLKNNCKYQLNIVEDKLFIDSLKNPFQLNNKKFVGKKILNKNDKIKIDDFEISIIDFTPKKEIDLKQAFKDLVDKNPIYSSLIQRLQEELIFIEGKINGK